MHDWLLIKKKSNRLQPHVDSRLKFRIYKTQQEDQTIEKLGPAVAAAKDKEGNPSKAAVGFAKSNNVSFEELQEIETDKGPRLGVKLTPKGRCN